MEASYTKALHTAFAGSVLRELGMHGQFVAETRERLAAAVTARADGRDRTRSQIQLARLIMSTGDPIEAAALGTQALDWAGTLRSGHIVRDLRDLRRLAEPHARLAEVAELRQHIGAVVAVC